MIDLLQIFCNNLCMNPLVYKHRAKNHRLTSQKRAVYDALEENPLTVNQLCTKLKQQKISINKATVYRILRHYLTLHLVNKTNYIDSSARYEKVLQQSHNHRLICERCSQIENVCFSNEKFILNISRKHGFKIMRHTLELFGLCTKCQKIKN